MTALAQRQSGLLARLPAVRGRYEADAPLGPQTWFRVGGPAEVLFRPADAADLASFLRAKPADVPVTVIGRASNLLVRDGGVPGVVIRLPRSLAAIAVEPGQRIRAGAAALDMAVAAAAGAAGLGGLEFLRGIPGTVGGGLRMNAGAYGREFKDIVVEARLLTPEGAWRRCDAAALAFGYRRSGLPEGVIFVEALLQGEAERPDVIAARMGDIMAARDAAQPTRTATGGSTFKNPDPEAADGRKAWQLIDAAGCRGLALGGAMVSEKHCNFLVNTGRASAAEIEALGEEVRARVFAATGVMLEWEIRRVGVARRGEWA